MMAGTLLPESDTQVVGAFFTIRPDRISFSVRDPFDEDDDDDDYDDGYDIDEDDDEDDDFLYEDVEINDDDEIRVGGGGSYVPAFGDDDEYDD